MKRYVCLPLLTVVLAAVSLPAQQSLPDLAARQESEERYRAMQSRIENLEEAIQSYQKRLNTLGAEMQTLREEIARLNNNSVNAATQQSLESLAAAIKEVDQKRLADNKNVLATLAEIRKSLTGRPPGGSSARSTPSVRPRNPNEKGFEYTVRSGDNAYVIVSDLSAVKGIKVSVQEILDANPGLDWNRLKVGQKIFIPEP